MQLHELVAGIHPVHDAAAKACIARFDQIAKPVGSLGRLEELLARIAAVAGAPEIDIGRKAVVVFCADNGVVQENVTQSDASVTRIVARKIAAGQGNINAMACTIGADVACVDVGMLEGEGHPNLMERVIARGTNNIAQGPAMSLAQANQGMAIGISLVKELADSGYRIIAIGEMGIGNTTTSSAVAAALLGLPVEDVVGRGAGLSDEGLVRKRAVIARAIALNKPDSTDPIDVLCKLGGFDMAVMCGAFLGGAKYGVPMLIDGLISAVAALLAARVAPDAKNYMLASHVSREPLGLSVLDELALCAPIHAGMALGEGTGAVMMLGLLETALSVYRQNTTMGSMGLAQYEHFDEVQT